MPLQTVRLGPSLLVVSVAALLGCHSQPSPDDSINLVIRNVTVVDVESGFTRPHHTILIGGDRIQAIQPADSVANIAATIELDGAGGFVIPGLWDMHVHTASPTYLGAFLAHGVTGIRDMGGGAPASTDGCETLVLDSLLTWRHAIVAGQRVGPRMVAAGPALSGTGWPTSVPVRDTTEARRGVRQVLARGADFAKVYEEIPLATYLVLAEEARSLGLVFAGHVPRTTVRLLEALRSGQRSIEHVRDPLLVCFTDDVRVLERFMREDGWSATDIAWGQLAHAECADAIRLLLEGSAWLVPTLTVEAAKITFDDSTWAHDPRRAKLPPSVREGFIRHQATQRGRDSIEHASEARWWGAQQQLVRRMQQAGARLMAGTDAACEGGIPGASLHRELQLLVAVGLTPLEALRTATIEPARYLEAIDSLGSVTVGKLADLVLLAQNPLEDIRHTEQIRAVIVGGRVYRVASP